MFKLSSRGLLDSLARKLIGQFKISRIAVDGNGRGTDMGSVFIRNSSTWRA